ncbi:MAG: hypothetical protein Kow00109_30040 [Acidobacteriota bacterium]
MDAAGLERSPDQVAEELRLFVLQLRRLDSLPTVALQVIEAAAGEDSTRRDLVRMLESDASLAARVVKVANSAWLGSPGRIDSLDRAMAVLGFDMVRNIALSVFISRLFLQGGEGDQLRLRELWYHSLACAVAAERLARKMEGKAGPAAFMAGLLHDLGKVVFLKWNHKLYQEAVRESRQTRLALHEVERRRFGVDHAELGSLLLEDWNFPEHLTEAVGGHHRRDWTPRDRGSMACIVACANVFCQQRRFGFSGSGSPDFSPSRLVELTGAGESELREISVDVLKRFEEAASLFSEGESTPDLFFDAVARANQELSEMYALLVERTRQREAAEQELRKKEEQLNRSQRLEAVGQLAGGIAHDFNNFLTVIMGFGDLLREGIPPGSPLRQHVDTIMNVAERAATLTRQLLAFSRRQVLKPKVVVLNSVITEVQMLLVRLLGENVKLVTQFDPRLSPVRVDPGGIEQVIVNLALNARDAMVDGGTLKIETANVELAREYVDSFGRLAPGRYVLLKVSDTGHGMTKETQERIFEPFFTTKKKGTGMGLATVYGIVKQSGGSIFVESEVGVGTTFRIFFPPVDQDVELEPAVPVPAAEAVENGSETVLVAEDEEEILALVEQVLKQVGYRVLTARNGEEALNKAVSYQGTIHLLLTDAVMPVLNGRELVERLRPHRPNMKVLFMSGYTGSGILHRAVAGQDVAFLAKPFTPNQLARKVQEVLRSE